MSQVLNLKKTELNMLAAFLGHDVRVHREFYRLPEATMQVAKISKLLMTMEQGVGRWRGKSMDELDLDFDDVSSVGEENGDGINEDDDLHSTEEKGARGKRRDRELKKSRAHRTWTAAEKAAVRSQLGDFFRTL